MAEEQNLSQEDIDKLMSDDGELDQGWEDDFEKGQPEEQSAEPPAHSFDQLPSETKSDDSEAKPLDFILDIPLDVTVQLGHTKMAINELLQLGQGSVIELSKLAGEPLEILVNNKLVARGEVVVINEKFGVRVTDIVSPMERVKKLA
ncbi:MAG: flagellar motor switch protein FliN [Thermodesulfobacteriota bacterium]|nr:flagellar motor switch protein FliN [Thermodesulfobacteriota bacterium]